LKKVSSFAATLLLLLCFGFSGLLYVVYDAAMLYDKMEADGNISLNEHLQKIKIPLKQFDKKNTKEVWAQGKLYDVSSYVIIKDTVVLLAFHDEDEESLLSVIKDSFEPYNSSVSGCINHIAQHHIHPPLDNKILVGRLSISIVKVGWQVLPRPGFLPHYLQVCASVSTPPPRRC
jgi:hypothetical protein